MTEGEDRRGRHAGDLAPHRGHLSASAHMHTLSPSPRSAGARGWGDGSQSAPLTEQGSLRVSLRRGGGKAGLRPPPGGRTRPRPAQAGPSGKLASAAARRPPRFPSWGGQGQPRALLVRAVKGLARDRLAGRLRAPGSRVGEVVAERGLWSLAGLRARHAPPVTHGSGKRLASQHACAVSPQGAGPGTPRTHTRPLPPARPRIAAASQGRARGQGPGASPQATQAEPAGHTRLTPAHTWCPATAPRPRSWRQLPAPLLPVFSHAT